jgi:hypothetical protein
MFLQAREHWARAWIQGTVSLNLDQKVAGETEPELHIEPFQKNIRRPKFSCSHVLKTPTCSNVIKFTVGNQPPYASLFKLRTPEINLQPGIHLFTSSIFELLSERTSSSRGENPFSSRILFLVFKFVIPSFTPSLFVKVSHAI